MLYCGLDIATKGSYYYITDKEGKKIANGEAPTDKDGLRARLAAHIREGMTIAIEAGNQTRWIYDYLRECGAEVVVVNAMRVKAIANSKRKTDKVDAKILCKLLRMGELPEAVHMGSDDCCELRGLLMARRQLVRSRSKVCNVVRGIVKQEGVRLQSRELNTYKGWESLLQREWRLKHIEVVIRSYRASYHQLTESIKEIDKALEDREKKDPRVEVLKTMPMVGKTASQTLLAAVDGIERFSNSKKLVSYSGLAPSVRSSGDRTEYGAITREGRSEVRGVWCQIAHLIATSKKSEVAPLREWFERVAERRGKRTAIVALTRKLLTIAYRMLRDNVAYDPQRLKLSVANA